MPTTSVVTFVRIVVIQQSPLRQLTGRFPATISFGHAHEIAVKSGVHLCFMR
jgi:hypothetical protein